jgi:hypothetical protein
LGPVVGTADGLLVGIELRVGDPLRECVVGAGGSKVLGASGVLAVHAPPARTISAIGASSR